MPMTESESQCFADSLRSFLSKRKASDDADPDSQIKAQAKSLKTERIATAQWLQAIDNGLDCILDVSFNDLKGDEKAWGEDWDPVRGPEYPPYTAAFCNDEEQIQLCGCYLLEQLFGMSVVRLPPPCHFERPRVAQNGSPARNFLNAVRAKRGLKVATMWPAPLTVTNWKSSYPIA